MASPSSRDDRRVAGADGSGDRGDEPHGGVVVLAGFALGWAVLGLSGLPGRGVAVTVAVVLGLVLVGAAPFLRRPSGARRASPSDAAPFPSDWRRRLGWVTAGQAVAIAGVAVVLSRVGRHEYIPAAVCFVVAAHFVPLSTLFAEGVYRRTAAGLALVAAVGLVAAVAGTGAGVSRLVVGFGAASVLWLTAVYLARQEPPALS